MQQQEFEAKPQRVHEFKKLANTKMMRFQSFLRGVGSIVVLMPSTPTLLSRSRVGSFSETSRRVAQFWNR